MKKAKNALAIIAIVLTVLAAIVAVGLPLIDVLAAKGDMGSADIMGHLNAMLANLQNMFKFDWFGDIGNHIPELVTLGLAGVGVILFIVLFVLMLCKKHVKGLGWFFPMLIVFLLAAAVVGGNKFDNAGYVLNSFKEVGLFGNIATYVSIGAAALMILSVIFYMVYVCKSGSKAKVEKAKADAIAKIDALLGGNK